MPEYSVLFLVMKGTNRYGGQRARAQYAPRAGRSAIHARSQPIAWVKATATFNFIVKLLQFILFAFLESRLR